MVPEIITGTVMPVSRMARCARWCVVFTFDSEMPNAVAVSRTE
jgi:hypothetical protein